MWVDPNSDQLAVGTFLAMQSPNGSVGWLWVDGTAPVMTEYWAMTSKFGSPAADGPMPVVIDRVPNVNHATLADFKSWLAAQGNVLANLTWFQHSVQQLPGVPSD